MKRLSAVVFPNTVPAEQMLIPLVLVFEPVVYYQPVENDETVAPQGSFCEDMVEQKLCSLHSPSPLKENRERFLHLINDLRYRRDDYAAQLSHVSLAGISSVSQAGTESKSSILSNLLRGQGINSMEIEAKEKLLWQARLVLKLGEQFDADQEKMAEDIHRIQKEEQNLFAGMKQDDDRSFKLTEKLSSLDPGQDSMQRLRLKAWARLYGFGIEPLAGEKVFISANQDGVERLCEEYERTTGIKPTAFLSFSLPAFSQDEKLFWEQLNKYFLEETAQRIKLSEMFEHPAPVHSEQETDLQKKVDQYFSHQDFGRCKLILFSLPGTRVKQLFLESFGHDEDNLVVELTDEAKQDIIIGLLSE